MKIFKELFIKGKTDDLNKFILNIINYVNGDWSYKIEKIDAYKYIFFDYTGIDLPRARVSILIEDSFNLNRDFLRVGNIIPLEKNELNIDEYNKLLGKFYEDIIEPFYVENKYVNIDFQDNDEFNPLEHISKTALEKLEKFSICANKSTGASHPEDKKRWFSFIHQTVEDDRVFDGGVLYEFLQDEDYWKDKGGSWSEEMADKLVDEYEYGVEILKHGN